MSADAELSNQGRGVRPSTVSGWAIIGGLIFASVLGDQLYSTVLIFSGHVRLGYFPVIMSAEGLVAAVVGAISGIVALVILDALARAHKRARWSLVSLVPFLVLWGGLFYLTNVADSALLELLFILLGLALASGTLWVLLVLIHAPRSRTVYGTVAASIAVIIALGYPWTLAVAFG